MRPSGIFILLSVFCRSVFTVNVKSGPVLSFEPMPPAINGTENTLIWYESNNLDNIKEIVKNLSDFLAVYKDPSLMPGRNGNLYVCDYHHPAPKGKLCTIDVVSLNPCIEENYFGYHKGSPCVIFKVENTEGWMPEYYNSSNDLPEAMPLYLRRHIEGVERYQREKLNSVWLSCEGEQLVDKELIGPLLYAREWGFPGYFFHEQNPEGYLSPLVALQIQRPKRGVVIYVECKLWAKNIVHDLKAKVGAVQFQFLVD